MRVNIDRHVFLEIVTIRKKRRELRKKFESVKQQFKTKLNNYQEEISELDGQEDALLMHLVGSIEKVDTKKGQETKEGKEIVKEIMKINLKRRSQ